MTDDEPLPVKKMRRVRDEEDTLPKRRFPVWGWLLLGVGGTVLTCGGGAMIVNATLIRIVDRADNAKAAKKADPKTKVWNQTELLAAVQGKTATEVKALLGTPDSTGGGDPDVIVDGYPSFYYRDLVYDPHTNKAKGVRVNFEDRKVSGLSIH